MSVREQTVYFLGTDAIPRGCNWRHTPVWRLYTAGFAGLQWGLKMSQCHVIIFVPFVPVCSALVLDWLSVGGQISKPIFAY